MKRQKKSSVDSNSLHSGILASETLSAPEDPVVVTTRAKRLRNIDESSPPEGDLEAPASKRTSRPRSKIDYRKMNGSLVAK